MNIVRAALPFFLIALVSAASTVSAQSTQFVEKQRDWSVYKFEGDGKRLCFAVSRPKDVEPKSEQRNDVFFYVTNWASEKVSNEVSVKLGYPTREGTDVEIQVGSEKFTLFTKGDKAFVDSLAEERKLVDAMRRGNQMVVKARTQGGTETTDSYSLFGISAALKKAGDECS